MVIKKRRIRSLNANLSFVEPGEVITPSFRITPDNVQKLKASGFPEPLSVGTRLLPKSLGRVSRYNAEGKHIVRRDLPKETVYYLRDHYYYERHGDERVLQHMLVDVPYERYPRDFVPPPGVELTVQSDPSGQLFVTAESETYTPDNEKTLLHKLNLFLELFGECEILKNDLTAFLPLSVQRVNWEILPKGELPWEVIQRTLEPAVKREKERKQAAIWSRFETVQGHKPDFHAVGRAGFSGYVVFGFERLGLYVLESVHYGNATYIFNKQWQLLSQMTKAEILNESLQFARLIHLTSWPTQLREILSSNAARAA
jgi:hypothetical protein